MIKNYFLIALRNIRRHLGYSGITIVGLAISMAICLLILQYIFFERSYDDFHKQGESIYRLKMVVYTGEGRTFKFVTAPRSLGPTLKAEFPEIVEFSRIHTQQEIIVKGGDKKFYEAKIFYTDTSFFRVFSFPLLQGDPNSVLSQPNTVMISELAAKKYFGNENPVGKTIWISDRYGPDYTVEGIFKDIPQNSHMKFDLLASNFNIIRHPYFKHGWKVFQFYTYILVHPGTNSKLLETKIARIIEKYLGEEERKNNNRIECRLQPLKDIHLYSNCIMEFEENGEARSLVILLISALFILIIAWVNHINICTARALSRAKEVGLRKVVGANRGQLLRQFLLESLMLISLSAILAIIIILLLIPLYNQLSQMPSFKPAAVLKGNFIKYGSGNMLRKVLVVFQFIISIALIAFTLTAYRQINFMRSRNLGFDKDHVLVVRTPNTNLTPTTRKKLEIMKAEMLKSSQIVNIAASFHVPGHSMDADATIKREGDDTKKTILTEVSWVRYNFLDTFGITLLAGRDFSEEIKSDEQAAIINEKLMRLLGYQSQEKAINSCLIEENGQRLRIIGVVKDYNHHSLREAITPRLLRLSFRELTGFFSFKFNTQHLSDTVNFIKTKWNEVFPQLPFDYFFLDEFFDRQYKTDIRFGGIIGFLTLITIFIAASGLFGLSAFSAGQRIREIGIRKVLGATVPGILALLSRDFLKLVFLALFIALPLAHLYVDKWLLTFAYRTAIGLWFWVVPILIIVPIILVVLSYNVIKAANTNPVNALKFE